MNFAITLDVTAAETRTNFDGMTDRTRRDRNFFNRFFTQSSYARNSTEVTYKHAVCAKKRPLLGTKIALSWIRVIGRLKTDYTVCVVVVVIKAGRGENKYCRGKYNTAVNNMGNLTIFWSCEIKTQRILSDGSLHIYDI